MIAMLPIICFNVIWILCGMKCCDMSLIFRIVQLIVLRYDYLTHLHMQNVSNIVLCSPNIYFIGNLIEYFAQIYFISICSAEINWKLIKATDDIWFCRSIHWAVNITSVFADLQIFGDFELVLLHMSIKVNPFPLFSGSLILFSQKIIIVVSLK